MSESSPSAPYVLRRGMFTGKWEVRQRFCAAPDFVDEKIVSRHVTLQEALDEMRRLSKSVAEGVQA